MRDLKLDNFGFEGQYSFHDKIKNDTTYQNTLKKIDQDFIVDINRTMVHNMRYYQKQAFSVFDFLVNMEKNKYLFKELLYENFNGKDVPFYCFEMATGSGKTLLMGALILYLYKYQRKTNFLIITPNTTIYEKTINNFDTNNTKCVFSNMLDLKFNLVTGDNFTNKSSDYNQHADINIFIFNIQKFFERDSGVLKIDKPWEESFWKDRSGNTIPLREFLKKEELTVITDEAHHYQKFRVGTENKSSGDIIVDLLPEMVLEFTATAIANEETAEQRKQKIIYNYGINQFISDGYGKKVRAFGYTGAPDRGNTLDVTIDDKKKFIVSFMIHIVKKKALSENNFKPILVVRARETEHANNLYDWIQNEISSSEEKNLLKETYEELINGVEYDITQLIKRYVSFELLESEINKLTEKTILYHYKNQDEPIVKDKIQTIDYNDQEVIIQVKKLDEGWDIKNPYTMLILSTTQDKIKTHVKQFIGRGLRLFRDVRIYDEPSNPLLKQQEILHVICEKGSNFDQFISEIRGELGWSKELFEEEYIQEEKNDITIAKIDQYNEIKLPILTRSSQFIKNELDLINDLTYENLNIDFFVDRNTYIEQNNKYWSFEEKDRLSEEDIVDSIDLKRGQGRITNLPLIIDSKEINRIIAKVISGQNLLPSHPIVKSKLFESISKLNDANIFYKKRNESSRNYYINNLTQNLSEFLIKKLNNYYEGKDIIKHEYMKQIFKDRTVTIKKNFSKDKIINTISNLNVDLNKIDFRNYLIEGFNKSYYNFNWFESSHEYKLAFELDKLSEVEFWIRNKREYYHEYGVGNHYHPDFIVKVGDKLYTIEVKGTGYLDSSITRNQIDMLKKLSSEGHGTIFLLDSTVDDKIYWKVKTFQDILNNNDLYKIYEIGEDNQKTLL